jgi:hypothetical protein
MYAGTWKALQICLAASSDCSTCCESTAFLQALRHLVGDLSRSGQDAGRAGHVLEELGRVLRDLQALRCGQRSGVEWGDADQRMKQALHPVVDDLRRRDGLNV